MNIFNKEIKELKEEVKLWEEYNKIKNDITRDEIKSLKRYRNKLKDLYKQYK